MWVGICCIIAQSEEIVSKLVYRFAETWSRNIKGNLVKD